MSTENDRVLALAEACRSLARTCISPHRRDHLQIIARMSDFEAELVQQALKRIADSKKLIARTDVLLRRR